MDIGPADFAREDFQALMSFHLEEAARQAASHVYNPDKLQEPDMSVFEARGGNGALLGFAGLKRLDTGHGEIKSVRTHPDHLRKGVSRALMDHVMRFARELGLSRLSLETHPTPAYAAARTFYEGLGFDYCGPFGDYTDCGTSVFMTRRI